MKYNLDCGCNVRNKKEIFKCSKCNKSLCSKHSYYYVDENNVAITNNASANCEDCIKKEGY